MLKYTREYTHTHIHPLLVRMSATLFPTLSSLDSGSPKVAVFNGQIWCHVIASPPELLISEGSDQDDHLILTISQQVDIKVETENLLNPSF